MLLSFRTPRVREVKLDGDKRCDARRSRLADYESERRSIQRLPTAHTGQTLEIFSYARPEANS